MSSLDSDTVHHHHSVQLTQYRTEKFQKVAILLFFRQCSSDVLLAQMCQCSSDVSFSSLSDFFLGGNTWSSRRLLLSPDGRHRQQWIPSSMGRHIADFHCFMPWPCTRHVQSHGRRIFADWRHGGTVLSSVQLYPNWIPNDCITWYQGQRRW